MTTAHQQTNSDLRVFGGAVIALFLLGALGGIYYPRLSHWLRHHSDQARVLTADRGCNPVNHSCAAGDAALTITLSLGERIEPLTPFPVMVHLTGAEAATVAKVTVHFTMVDMAMGINRFDLSPRAEGHWQGSALLPVCTLGRRDWRVTVDVASDTPAVGEFYLLTGS
jgi:hypothetical protein